MAVSQSSVVSGALQSVTIGKPREGRRITSDVRGITFCPNGQQYSGYLPAGEYLILGECELAYSDLGRVKRSPAVKLQTTGAYVHHWYIAPCVLASILAGDR